MGRVLMEPGLYVVRRRNANATKRTNLIVESVCFTGERAQVDAGNWRDFIADEHPNDDVFIIERRPNHD